jgi:hypothetical protein
MGKYLKKNVNNVSSQTCCQVKRTTLLHAAWLAWRIDCIRKGQKLNPTMYTKNVQGLQFHEPMVSLGLAGLSGYCLASPWEVIPCTYEFLAPKPCTWWKYWIESGASTRTLLALYIQYNVGGTRNPRKRVSCVVSSSPKIEMKTEGWNGVKTALIWKTAHSMAQSRWQWFLISLTKKLLFQITIVRSLASNAEARGTAAVLVSQPESQDVDMVMSAVDHVSWIPGFGPSSQANSKDLATLTKGNLHYFWTML